MIHFPKLTEDQKKLTPTMSPKEVCEELGISKSTLKRWSNKENKLPYIMINRKKRFKVNDVEELLENHYSPNLT